MGYSSLECHRDDVALASSVKGSRVVPLKDVANMTLR